MLPVHSATKRLKRAKAFNRLLMQDELAAFTIEVSFLAGGGESITARDSELVRDLKVRLCAPRKMELEGVKLIFQGLALPDDRTLKSLGVGPTARGSPVLYVIELLQAAASGRISENHREPGLRVVNLAGGELIVPAQSFDTVLKLKLALQPKLELLPALMRLLHGGVELRDEETLDFYGIASTSTVYLLPNCAGEAPGELPEPEPKSPVEGIGIAGINPGMLIERRIDSFWFPAKVLRVTKDDILKVDMQYLDDGNVEHGVAWVECRHVLVSA